MPGGNRAASILPTLRLQLGCKQGLLKAQQTNKVLLQATASLPRVASLTGVGRVTVLSLLICCNGIV